MKKTLFTIILIILLIAVFFGGRYLYSSILNEIEYKKDQNHLASVFKTELPAQPLPEIKLPVKSYLITTGGFCWLMTHAGIMNYLEPDIDLDKFILCGGPTLFMANRTEDERWGPGLNNKRSAKNLGYTMYRGSTSRIHPPQTVYPVMEPENFIYFKTVEEEILFIKKLLSVGNIPIVHVDASFVAVVGYDDEGVWLGSPEVSHEKYPDNFLTANTVEDTWFLPYDEFFGRWVGDKQFFWMEKTGGKITDEELYAQLKKDALEAPDNISKTIEDLKNFDSTKRSISRLYTYGYDTPSAAALYKYFLEKGNKSLAEKYLEIAQLFDNDRQAQGPYPPPTATAEELVALLTKIQPLYAQAAELWD